MLRRSSLRRDATRAGTTSMVSMSSKRPGATTPGTWRRHEEKAVGTSDRSSSLVRWPLVVASGSRSGRSARRRAAGAAAAEASAGRKRDPAHRHDELHRLVQPLELHRGTGTERDDHGLPAAHRGRLFEAGGLLRQRRLGQVVEGLGRRQGLDVQAAAEHEVVRRQADDRCRCGVDDQHDAQVRGRRDSGAGDVAQPREERVGAESDHPRRALRGPGRERSLAHRRAPDRAAAYLGAVREEAEGRQGAQDVPARGEAPDGDRRRVHDQAVREEGHDRLHPGSELLRAEVECRRGRADVLHELRLDDRRPAAGEPRLDRPGAVQRRERGQEEQGREGERVARRRDHEHHVEREPAEAQEPRAPRPAREEGALDVRRPRQDDPGRLQRLCDEGREPRRAHLASRESEPRADEVQLQRRRTRRSTRSATSEARTAFASLRPRSASTRRAPIR